MTGWDDDYVARYDLRPDEAVRQFVADRRWQHGGTRALVIVHAEDLREMRDTLFDIAVAGKMSVIYLVIGRPAEGRTHPALSLPGVLSRDGIATLWVSDDEGRGCGWWIDSDAPLTSAEAVLGRDSEPALDLLDDCLQIADVFDRVLRETQQMGDHVASPGLIAYGGRLSSADLIAARVGALRAVTGDGPPGRPRDDEVTLSVPAGAGTAGPALLPGSAVRRAREDAAEDAERAARLSGPAAAWLFLTAPTGRRPDDVLDAARHRVEQYRRALGKALTAAHHPGAALDTDAVDRIADQGVDTGTIDWLARDALLGDLRRRTEQRLRTSSLEATRLWLRQVADAVTPLGSGGHVPGLAGMGANGGAVPGLPLPARPWPLVGALGVAAMLGGLAGLPGAAVPVAALAILGWTASRRPAGSGPAWTALAVPLVAVAAGFAAGFTSATRTDVGYGPAAAAAGAVVAVLAIGWWWLGAARSWIRQARVHGPRDDVRRLDALLDRVVTGEWRTATARAHAADAAIAAARALGLLAGVLRRHGDALAAGQVPQRPGSAADDLEAVIATDLRDAVESSMEPFWDQLTRAGSPAGSWDYPVERLTDHLEEYEQHLGTHDVTKAPPFARARPDRPRPANLWGPPQRLAELLRTPSDGPLVQLCRDRHVGLFSLNRVRGVRFAPASMQEVLTDELARRGGGPALAEMRWTRSGSLAGVVRLLAPRTGVIETTWEEEDEDHDD